MRTKPRVAGILLPATVLLATLTAGCAGASGGATPPTPAVAAPAAPPPDAPVPTAPVPDVAIPNAPIPDVPIPTVDIPTVTLPNIDFPEVRFPRIQLPEINLPSIVVQQGDDAGRKTTVYTVPADVLFDFDKSTIRPDADQALQEIAASLAQRAPTAHLEIRGHTDSVGGDDYNLALSQRRADAVRAWMVGRAHVDAGRMTTRPFGESRPVAPNTRPDGSDDPAGRQRNRRVEIVAQS